MPDRFDGKTYWIVGASEGLGRALALELDRAGVRLVLSARNEARLIDLAEDLSHASAVPLDVTDPASVRKAADQAGVLDGIIYCAGYYEPIPATDWDAEAVEAMCAVNFNGALHVLAAALPGMIAARAGHIVLIGSLAGFRGLPGAVGYGASKAALMHLAENLRADLHDSGLKVQCINPGFIRTRLTEKNDFDMPMIMSPEKAADHVMRAMRSGRFSTSFPAPFAWLFRFGRFLPLSLFHRIFQRD